MLVLACRLSHQSIMNCRKTADWIWVPSGVVSGVGRGMGVLDLVEIVEGEGIVLGVKVGSNKLS